MNPFYNMNPKVLIAKALNHEILTDDEIRFIVNLRHENILIRQFALQKGGNIIDINHKFILDDVLNAINVADSIARARWGNAEWADMLTVKEHDA